ncbi:FAD-dependent monooxygenase [Paenibacillus sp. 2KB_20]|uniref:FAD-dependent monooxygenase n=1 Tax=Paenibacillus sp. 2KB_20 TaxID=3232977 RepID=UPI003F9B1FFF
MMSKKITNVPVLIVGGGLAGLSAALFLSRHSVPYVLIERHQKTNIHPRARGLNFRTMELYREVGLDEAIDEVGAQLAKGKGWYTAHTLREAELDPEKMDIPKILPESVKSYFATLKKISPASSVRAIQNVVEPILLEAARERGGDLRFHTELTALEQNEDHVKATVLNRTTGVEETIVADYMIAADGAKSPLRQMVNIKMTEMNSHGHIINIYFEADLEHFVKGREFSACNITRTGAEGVLLAINNRDRWCYHVSYDFEGGETAANFTEERCKEIIQKAIDLPDLQVKILSVLPWEAAERVAEQFQQDRVFLIGDAVHLMPPTGGYGANTGVQDAHNLAWKLAAVVNKVAGPELLKTYEAERRPVALMTVSEAGRVADTGVFSAMKKQTEKRTSPFDDLIVSVGYHYESKAILEQDAASSSLKHFELKGQPGTRTPHIWGEYQGRERSTLDLLGLGFVLFAGEKAEGWKDAAKHVSGKFGVKINTYSVGQNGDFIDKDLGWQNAYQATEKSVVLVRPDGFVCWRCDDQIEQPTLTLEEVFAQLLGKEKSL